VKLCLLGGTGFLGNAIVDVALDTGHEVTCVARGASGAVPEGARHVAVNREDPDAYSALSTETFDAVVELTWQPSFARAALAALSDKVQAWCFVSSVSAYATHETVGMDETAPLLDPFVGEWASIDVYGEAKVACEQALLHARQERCLMLRPGLIGGPGDVSDRSGAWIARCAEAPTSPLLVPESPSSFVQVLDVRDLAKFIVSALCEDQTGIFNTVGEETSFSHFVEASRRLGGHVGEVRRAPWGRLQEFGVSEWAGPDSFACFVADPDMAGWGRVDGRGAKAAGLTLRPLEATLRDTLKDERSRGLDRPRRAGLSLDREQELLSLLEKPLAG